MTANTAPIALPSLRDVIQRYGLNARKSLGQHFLLDGNITAKIAQAGGDLHGLHVAEIGPGPGGLTRALLQQDALRVYGVEKDDRCIAALGELAESYPDRLRIFAQDALQFSPIHMLPEPRAIVANLPYNIGTPLLFGWLEDIARYGTGSYRFLTLMFQKEVAHRIFAPHGSKSYGRLSVMTQWLCDVEPCFDLPASAFTPPPKVDSSVILLTPLPQPRFPAAQKTLQCVLAAAFGQRRKMLRSSLSQITPETEQWLEAAAIDPSRRAETLSIEEFCALARSCPVQK